MNKLKPFKVVGYRWGIKHEMEVKPLVERPGAAGPNWVFKSGLGVLKFKNKRGVRRYFERKYQKVRFE